MFAVVAGHDEVQVETHLVEHRPDVGDALHRLRASKCPRFTHVVADDIVGKQFLGQG